MGSGGHADEVSAVLGQAVEFRAVSKQYIHGAGMIDIESPGEYVKASVNAAVGAPFVRKKLVDLWPGDDYAVVVADSAIIGPNTKIGKGTYVAHGAILTTDIILGEHVLVNVGSSLSHGVRCGDYATISPGVHVGGNVKVGRGVFIGIGATITNNVKIADGVVLGAGAVLIGDADVENGVYVGLPAKLLKVNPDWLHEI